MQPQGNPYLETMTGGPRIQVTRVNGRGGAEAFRMGPNSSAFLLDESGELLWAVTTDGAGYKTILPYDITPHQEAAPPDYSRIEARLTRLEEIIDGNTGDTTATGEG